jgi:hypothetical protein
MSRVEKHPIDEDKYQSTFDDYGHGEGNGKSRNAIYKRFKKINIEPVKEESDKEKSFEPILDEVPDWGQINWTDDTIEEGDDSDYVKSIPDPIAGLHDSKAVHLAMGAQAQVVRYGFKALDRLVTHWGRGVMGPTAEKWEIKRKEKDYDTLQDSTMMMMQHYGIMIPINPLMIWSLTVSTAYAPPIGHVLKNRDPNRPKRKGLFSRFRRKKKEPPLVSDEDGIES